MRRLLIVVCVSLFAAAAWSDPATGQFRTGAAYGNDYRQQRRPLGNDTIGHIFRINERAQAGIRGGIHKFL